MAKSKYFDYEGEAHWAKLREDNRDMGPEDDSDLGKKLTAQGGQYTVDFHITQEVKDKMVKDGFPENKMGHDQFKDLGEGMWVTKLKRKHMLPASGDREDIVFGPPKVYDFNESKVSITLSRYGEGQRCITEFTEVRVLELVEYEGGRKDFWEEQ